MTFQIRQMNEEEVHFAVDWARKEGWNPGLYDAEFFLKQILQVSLLVYWMMNLLEQEAPLPTTSNSDFADYISSNLNIGNMAMALN